MKIKNTLLDPEEFLAVIMADMHYIHGIIHEREYLNILEFYPGSEQHRVIKTSLK